MLTLNALHAAELGLTVLATGSVATLLVVSDARRSASQRWLAAFLFLVCANFAAELAATATGLYVDLGDSTGPAVEPWALRYHSLATVFLALDPFALVYFASLFPRRTGIAERGWAAGALLAVAGAFVAIEVTTHGISRITPLAPLRIAFFAYLSGCYLWGAQRLLRSFLDEPSSIMATQLRVTLVGALFVLVSRVALVSVDLLVPSTTTASLVDLACRLAVVGLLIAASVTLVRRSGASPSRKTEALGLVRTVSILLAGVAALWIVGAVARVIDASLLEAAASDSVFAVRWFVFSGAMTGGILRYQALAVGRRAGQVASSLTAGAAAIILAVAAALAWGAWAGILVASAAVLTLAIALPVIVGRSESSRRSGLLARRRLEVYRAHLAGALASGGLTPDAERGLARDRKLLGIHDAEHEALLAIARAEEGRSAPAPMLGRYRILRRLGSGGFASVYLAEDATEGGLVALKRIHAEWVGDNEAMGAARREFEVAKRLSHPRIVTVHDVLGIDDGFVVVMKYAEGGSLRERLDRDGKLSPAEVSQLVREVLEGLSALHDAGIVHGDLKPENILLDAEGHAMLADFGAARSDTLTRTLVSMTLAAEPARGTPRYMAPEVARGAPPTRASDLYALGAVAFEALTGTPLVDDAQRRRELDRDAPRAWRSFLTRALATRPEDRQRSADEAMAEAMYAQGPVTP